ncbi:SIMPL domain-containing protein [Wolinella succinogenes]|uniref:SIMPL domain-containing protein n=1 Tax=Wolinella succinogenes TaxID=844 RepID=UPI00240A0553|nr:SIMPL domain-containing protein [Wolinella succinogenes]
MRIILLSLLLFFSFSLAKSEESLEGFTLSREISLQEKVTPSRYLSNPSLRASEYLRNKPDLTSAEKAQITQALNQILDRVSKEKFCKGGSYSIDPLYEFNEGRQKLIGHQLFLNLSCTLKNEEIARFNALINDIDKMASSSGFLLFSVPSLSATLSSEDIAMAKEAAYEKILALALDKAKEYSQIALKKCSLIGVEFDSTPSMTPRIMSARLKSGDSMEGSAIEPGVPLVQEEDLPISAQVTYRCK